MKEIKKKLGKKTGYIITLLSLMMIALAMPTYASADLVEPAINNISGEETAFGFVILVATGAVICIAILSVVALIRIRDKRKTFSIKPGQKPTEEQLNEVKEAVKNEIVFDEDSPELSPAMYKAFHCAVTQRNRRRKA